MNRRLQVAGCRLHLRFIGPLELEIRASTHSKPLLLKLLCYVPSPPGKGEKVADRPDEGGNMAVSKKTPSPRPLPQIVCGDAVV